MSGKLKREILRAVEKLGRERVKKDPKRRIKWRPVTGRPPLRGPRDW